MGKNQVQLSFDKTEYVLSMVIFFDIDDTLIDSKSAHWIALEEVCREFSLQPEVNQIFAEWRLISDKYLKLYFHNKLTINEQRILRIKDLWQYAGKQISDMEATIVHKKYHTLFLQHCVPFPDTLPTLKKLEKFRLGIITNGPISDQTRKLENNGLAQFFNPVIISEEVGYWKPQKEIFEFAAQRAQHLISECVFIGDSYDLDYLGGTRAGMKCVWLNKDRSSLIQNIEKIAKLGELLKHKYLKGNTDIPVYKFRTPP